MNSSSRQQAYDRGHTIFSPDGRLYQVEYAREAVERGSPSVGVLTDDGVVLAARKRLRSPLLEPDSVEKIHRVDDHVAVATAGHAADARQLVETARKHSQQHRLRYGEPITSGLLASELADHIQEQTQAGGTRPYGAALLVGGVDSAANGSGTAQSDDELALYEVDPGGTHYGWRGTAIGDGTAEIRSFLEYRLDSGNGSGDGDSSGEEPSYNREQGLSIALEALAIPSDDDLSPTTVDARVLDLDTAQSDQIGDDELAQVLAELESR